MNLFPLFSTDTNNKNEMHVLCIGWSHFFLRKSRWIPFFVFSQSLYLNETRKIKLSKLDSFIQNFKQQNLLDWYFRKDVRSTIFTTKWNDKNFNPHLLLSCYIRNIRNSRGCNAPYIVYQLDFLFFLPSKEGGGKKKISKSSRIPVLETKTAFILRANRPKAADYPLHHTRPSHLDSAPVARFGRRHLEHPLEAKIAGASGRARAPG